MPAFFISAPRPNGARIRLVLLQSRALGGIVAASPPSIAVPSSSHPARSHRAGILLVAMAIGYSAALSLISLAEPDARVAPLGMIPFAIGISYFIDASLLRRELRPSG